MKQALFTAHINMQQKTKIHTKLDKAVIKSRTDQELLERVGEAIRILNRGSQCDCIDKLHNNDEPHSHALPHTGPHIHADIFYQIISIHAVSYFKCKKKEQMTKSNLKRIHQLALL